MRSMPSVAGAVDVSDIVEGCIVTAVSLEFAVIDVRIGPLGV